jgi:hypothetical protein
MIDMRLNIIVTETNRVVDIIDKMICFSRYINICYCIYNYI